MLLPPVRRRLAAGCGAVRGSPAGGCLANVAGVEPEGRPVRSDRLFPAGQSGQLLAADRGGFRSQTADHQSGCNTAGSAGDLEATHKNEQSCIFCNLYREMKIS